MIHVLFTDYYTDPSKDGDFTAVPYENAKTITITGGTDDTQVETITIAINPDGVCESEESFNVYLTNVEGGVFGTQCSNTVYIQDDDSNVICFII